MPRLVTPTRRVALNMKTTQEVRARLAAAAALSGRSLTSEVEYRIECSLRDDAMKRQIEDAVAVGVTNALMLSDKSAAPVAEPISSPLPSYAQ